MRRALAALALASVLLAAAPARAWIIQHANNALDATLSPEQFRPAADGGRPWVGNPAAPILVELLPAQPLLDPRVPAAIHRSILKWNQPGSSLAITAAEVNKGEFGSWESRYEHDDGRNTIEFVTADWFWSPNTVAITIPRLDDNGRIREADIFCNAVNFTWSVLPEAGADPFTPPGKMVVDTEAVITHEMGHLVGLGHSERDWACMYPYLDPRSTRSRRLTSDDRAGLRFLYPRSAADVPPADLWGVARDFFGDGPCGLPVITYMTALYTYVYRTVPLPGPHDLIPSPDWPSPYHYCLMGSGFVSAPTSSGLLSGSAVAAAGVDTQAIGPNFVRASLDDGGSVFPVLPDGVYDFFINQAAGGTAVLPQGLFILPATSELPVATLVAKPLAAAGGAVRLDASTSYDPAAAPLTYRYELIESPVPAQLSSAGDQARLSLPAAGVYVVQLIVNNGTIDSIADQAVIEAVYFPEPGSTDLGFGCAVVRDRPAAGLASLWALLAPAVVLLTRIVSPPRQRNKNSRSWPLF